MLNRMVIPTSVPGQMPPSFRIAAFVSDFKDFVDTLSLSRYRTAQGLDAAGEVGQVHSVKPCIASGCERPGCVLYRQALVRSIVDAGVRPVRT